MSERGEDSEAPEEFTAEQGLLQDEEISKLQKENKARVVREGKERRRKWAERKTPKQSGGDKKAEDLVEDDKKLVEVEKNLVEDGVGPGFVGGSGMLPSDIVELLAAHEKQVFSSDSEGEVKEKPSSRKRKRAKPSGLEPVILEEIPPAQCLQTSLDFLKKSKMQVPRSNSVLNNSNQALRLLSTSGLLKK